MKVINAETQEVIGYLVNITTDGLMLTSEAPLDTEAVFQLKVIFPAEIKGSKELTLSATSRWCDQDEEDSRFYNTGFQLVDLPKPDAKIIKQLMKKYCF